MLRCGKDTEKCTHRHTTREGTRRCTKCTNVVDNLSSPGTDYTLTKKTDRRKGEERNEEEDREWVERRDNNSSSSAQQRRLSKVWLVYRFRPSCMTVEAMITKKLNIVYTDMGLLRCLRQGQTGLGCSMNTDPGSACG